MAFTAGEYKKLARLVNDEIERWECAALVRAQAAGQESALVRVARTKSRTYQNLLRKLQLLAACHLTSDQEGE